MAWYRNSGGVKSCKTVADESLARTGNEKKRLVFPRERPADTQAEEKGFVVFGISASSGLDSGDEDESVHRLMKLPLATVARL